MKIAAFLVALALLAPGAQVFAQDRFAIDADRVAIYNVAGEIRVESGGASNVVVEVTRGGNDGERLELHRREDGGWQQLIVRYPDNHVIYERMGRFSRTEFSVREDGTFGIPNLDPGLGVERIKRGQDSRGGGDRMRVSRAGRGLEAYADLRVQVPAGQALAIHLGVGRVIVTNVDGDLQIDARAGSIEATGLKTFARFDTGSGAITLREGAGNFGLHTGSGSIDVADISQGALVAATGSGAVDAANIEAEELEIRTGSGSVTLHDVSSPAARVVTGSGRIRAQRLGARNFELNTGSGSIHAELATDIEVGRIDTGSGSVQLAVPHDLGAQLTVNTGSGGINVEGSPFLISESRRGYLRGSIGDGSGTLHVSTGSGGVSFRSY